MATKTSTQIMLRPQNYFDSMSCGVGSGLCRKPIVALEVFRMARVATRAEIADTLLCAGCYQTKVKNREGYLPGGKVGKSLNWWYERIDVWEIYDIAEVWNSGALA